MAIPRDATVDELTPGLASATPPVALPLSVARRAHLIGIAGSGMAALARVLVDRGWILSGSDLRLEPVQGLGAEGVCLHAGHAARQLPEQVDLVIRSDAITPDNPELLRAAERRLPVASYFEMLGRLMAGQRGLAVAGTHGKSTTTAMAAEILVRAGRDPTVLCGAVPLGRPTGGRAGRGELVLVEACEYRANFLHLQPHIAVILDIEPDHFDYYRSLDEIEQAFARFVEKVPVEGAVLARHECPAVRRVVAAARCPVETFGLAPNADWSAQPLVQCQGRYTFEIAHRGERCAEISLRVPGLHNVLNALAAAALASRQGVEASLIARTLSGFRGLQRRLERVGSYRGAEVLDDYGHHPTEVHATLATVRQMYPGRRLWCVFQPHQASRTRRLLDEFALSLENTDKVLVAEIYRAREPAAAPGDVTAADLARAMRARGTSVPEVHDLDAIARLVDAELAPGDVLLTLGAGDIRNLLDKLQRSIDPVSEGRDALWAY